MPEYGLSYFLWRADYVQECQAAEGGSCSGSDGSFIDRDGFAVFDTAPVPGKRNESGYVKMVAEAAAELKGITVEELAEITTRNAMERFSIKQNPEQKR